MILAGSAQEGEVCSHPRSTGSRLAANASIIPVTPYFCECAHGWLVHDLEKRMQSPHHELVVTPGTIASSASLQRLKSYQ